MIFQLGCPEKSQHSNQNQSQSRSRSSISTEEMISSPSSSVILPLERIVKSKPIWHCPDVTRDEAVKLLHNKKTGVRLNSLNQSHWRIISAQPAKQFLSRNDGILAMNLMIKEDGHGQTDIFVSRVNFEINIFVKLQVLSGQVFD